MSCTVVAPADTRPYEGSVSVHAELGALAGPAHDAGGRAQTHTEVLFERVLDKVLRRGDVVDKEALCLVAGRFVFALHVGVHVLASPDGAVASAALLAAVVALRHFRRPEFAVSGRDVEVYSPAERVPVPLALHHTPYAVEHALFTLRAPKAAASGAPKGSAALGEYGDTLVLPHPTGLEARLADGSLVAVVNSAGEVALVEKNGGSPLAPAQVVTALANATAYAHILHKQIDDALAADLATRSLGGL